MLCEKIRCLNPACRVELSRQTGVFQYYFCTEGCFEKSTAGETATLQSLQEGLTRIGFSPFVGLPKFGTRPEYPDPDLEYRKLNPRKSVRKEVVQTLH